MRRPWSDRIKTLEEPLFRNYVFIQIEDTKRDEIFNYPGTVRYLFWLRRPAVVRKSEIVTIQNWLGEQDHEYIDVSPIIPGDYLRITSGQFAGEQAVVLERTNSRVIVQLSLSLSKNDLNAL